MGALELRSLGVRDVNGPKIHAYMCYHVKCCGSEINCRLYAEIERIHQNWGALGPAPAISVKISPRVNVTVAGLSLRIGHRCSGRKKLTRMMGLPGRGRSLTISSVESSGYNTRNLNVGRTDKRTDTGQHQRRTALIHSVSR